MSNLPWHYPDAPATFNCDTCHRTFDYDDRIAFSECCDKCSICAECYREWKESE